MENNSQEPKSIEDNKEQEDLHVKTKFKSFDKKGAKKTDEDKLPILYIVLGVLLAGIISLALIYFLGFGNVSDLISPLSGTDEAEVYGDSHGMVVNPLTGVEYPASQAQWIETRPLAAMVNNHVDARPQSGLIYADVVYEIVAEGGITRYIPFYLSETPEKIGPVRSARDYYLVLVKELGDAMLMHIGWSPQALEAIQNWPVRSLGRGGGQFWRENPRGVASEHTAYVNGVELRKLGEDLGWEGTRDFDVWEFKEDAPVLSDTEPGDPCEAIPAYCTPLSIDFWHRGDYSGIFEYNPENNSYLRSTGYDSEGNPIPLLDQETQEQVEVKNVIVQFADEQPVPNDDKGRLTYELVGSGSALVFMDGTVEEVTWSKEDRDARTMFYDLDGEQVQFNRGKFWISIVPTRNVSQVEY